MAVMSDVSRHAPLMCDAHASDGALLVAACLPKPFMCHAHASDCPHASDG
jgi:hypothetical protein